MPKILFTCHVCNNQVERYSSQVRNPKTFTCCVLCRAILQQTTQLEMNNPNYRHGRHTKNNKCQCGNRKDYRSKQCARCARRGYTRYDATALNIPEDIFRKVVTDSKSYVEVGYKLKISRTSAKKLILERGLDVTHFCTSGRAKRFSKPKEILVTNSCAGNGTIKACIKRNDLLPYTCMCGQKSIWKGKPLILQLHHRNGDPTDNRLENLEFICPNCHSQTPNYTGRNMPKIMEEKRVEVSHG